MSVGFRSGLTRWRYPEPSFHISPHSAHRESGSPFVVAWLLPAVSRLQASSAGSPAGTLLLKELLFPEPPLVSVESVTGIGVILTQEPCLRNAWHTQVFPDPELGREMRTSPLPPRKDQGRVDVGQETASLTTLPIICQSPITYSDVQFFCQKVKNRHFWNSVTFYACDSYVSFAPYSSLGSFSLLPLPTSSSFFLLFPPFSLSPTSHSFFFSSPSS